MRYGLIGWPLGHSISPQLHRRLAGVEYDLRPLPEAEFERFMRERDFSAVNVTIPYKRQVLPYCAQLTPAARRCGSVNLLIKGRDGTLTGDNTDLAGLEFLLRQNGWVLTGQTVVILGSGGTGHTAKAAAEELGAAEIATVSRTGELNYENLAKRFGKRDFYLINTTPVGMAPQSGVSPLDLRQFPRCKGVADVIYNPLRTRLCQQAAALGIPACGGLLMLAAQAAAAEYAFGTAVPGEETVLRVYRELLAERRNLVFIGMPGSGKTTLLRSIARELVRQHKILSVIDERRELFAGNIHGEALDVLAGLPKGQAVQMALRSLSPQVILLDELGGLDEVTALEQGLFSGVDFIATLHAATPEEATMRPQVKYLMERGAVRVLVWLTGRQAPGCIGEVRFL